MGLGDQNNYQQHDQMVRFHFHVPQIHHDGHERKGSRDIPKGYVAIMVGIEDEEELQRFVVPLIYINHPLFMELLKESEEEYGFDHDGPITIPCHVDEFRHVRDIIDEETHRRHSHGGDGDGHRQGRCENDHHHQHHHHNHHHHHHHFWCFRV